MCNLWCWCVRITCQHVVVHTVDTDEPEQVVSSLTMTPHPAAQVDTAEPGVFEGVCCAGLLVLCCTCCRSCSSSPTWACPTPTRHLCCWWRGPYWRTMQVQSLPLQLVCAAAVDLQVGCTCAQLRAPHLVGFVAARLLTVGVWYLCCRS